MWMFTAFCCVGAHPPAFCSVLLASSWMFFFGLYGPPYAGARIHPDSCAPQSLYGTPSRPTVQSSRGSTGVSVAEVRLSLRVFQVAGLVNASGRPDAGSTE